MPNTALVWFRRDLRDFDHAALHHALALCSRVHCAFVLDTEILDALPQRADRRVEFIRESLIELDTALRGKGGGLIVRHGIARDLIPSLALELGCDAVFANRDYEPAALQRDDAVRGALGAAGVAFHCFKDQVIFEEDEILTGAGKPFSVFTPYRNAWLKALAPGQLDAYASDELPGRFCAPAGAARIPTLEEIGFVPTNLRELKMPCGMSGAARLWTDFQARIDDYKTCRDFPARKGVSYLSTHLRFGTLSIRQLAGFARARGGEGAASWLDELIWREFYQQLLWHRPDVLTRSFRPEYDKVEWEEGPAADQLFLAWCEARTGFPLVDAAMRQLNQTGWMHNRLRMVVASFLSKDLGIHWLRGERYFAAALNDYDLAANNGGWQWAASTGCDAQPWFRIFNPVTQSERFDPQGRFIRRYVPELANVPDRFIHAPWLMGAIDQSLAGCRIGTDYPAPVVVHAQAREKTLARFKAIKNDATH